MSKTKDGIKRKAKPEEPVQASDLAAGTAVPTAADQQPVKVKKRKRDHDEEAEKPKKPKKSKKHAATNGTPVEEPVAEAKEEKKAKKSKKHGDSEPMETDGPVVNGKSDKKAKKSKKQADADTTPVENPSAKTKQEKKAKKSEKNAGSNPTLVEDAALEASGEKKDKKKSRKQRMAAKKATLAANGDAGPVVNEAEATPQEEPSNGDVEDATTGKKSRFIVFVGNLPYSATKEELQAHFAKVAPTDIRMMTDKVTKKPKGFAFVEFDRFDRMETCLKLYNHSMFGEGKKGRKINCELTAGGGGNTESRKQKIQAKNDKLYDERQREREKRDELEAKQKERKDKKESRQKKTGKSEGENGTVEKVADEHHGIHPARLAQMQAPASSGWRRQKY